VPRVGLRSDLLNEIEAFHPGHAVVGDDQVDTLFALEQTECLLRVAGSSRDVAGVLDRDFEDAAAGRIVVDYQDHAEASWCHFRYRRLGLPARVSRMGPDDGTGNARSWAGGNESSECQMSHP
jgi:hypothetical protein